MQLSGAKPEKMLKSLFRKYISLKSLILIALQKHMCVWEVGIINMTMSQTLSQSDTSTDMDMPENDCPELTEKTAEAIDNASLQELFISTQRNNLDLCVKAGLK